MLEVRKPLAVLFLGILLLAASCGGSGRLSKSEYRTRLTALDRDVTKAEAKARSSVVTPNATVDQIRSALTRVAAAQKHVGDEVAKLKPPKEAEAANSLLARGAHDLAGEVGTVAKQLATVKSRRQALGLVQSMLQTSRGATELDQAIAQLKKLGLAPGS